MALDHQRGDGDRHQTLHPRWRSRSCAVDGGELGEEVCAGDDARSVALSGLHLPCSSISKPRENLDHVDGQKILRMKCCKPSVELIEGLFGARVRVRLSWMMTPHHLRTVDPAAKKDIA